MIAAYRMVAEHWVTSRRLAQLQTKKKYLIKVMPKASRSSASIMLLAAPLVKEERRSVSLLFLA